MKRSFLFILVAAVGCAPADDPPPESSGPTSGPGAIDPGFGADGTAKVPESLFGARDGHGSDVGFAMELHDGRILLLATTAGVAQPGRAVMLNHDGSVDTTFGRGGAFAPDGRAHYRAAYELADGDLLLEGVESGTVFHRISRSGEPVTSFGTSGALALGDAKVAVDPIDGGGIYVSLRTGSDPGTHERLARFDLEGHRNAPIATSSVESDDTLAPLAPHYWSFDVELAALDGYVYVGRYIVSGRRIEVRRLTKAGLDTSWGNRGEIERRTDSSRFELHALPNGRLSMLGDFDHTDASVVTVDAAGTIGSVVTGFQSWTHDMRMNIDPKAGTFYDLVRDDVLTAPRTFVTNTRVLRARLDGPDPSWAPLTLTDEPRHTEVFVGASTFYTFGKTESGSLSITRRAK